VTVPLLLGGRGGGLGLHITHVAGLESYLNATFNHDQSNCLATIQYTNVTDRQNRPDDGPIA